MNESSFYAVCVVCATIIVISLLIFANDVLSRRDKARAAMRKDELAHRRAA